MATTLAAETQPRRDERLERAAADTGSSWWPRLGVRARQITRITFLVALVVIVTTVINIAHLTGVIVSRTTEQANQVSGQIAYAVQQELGQKSSVEPLDDYEALVSDRSPVRGLMESTIAYSRTITYLYLTSPSGQIIADKEGHRELAANKHMIGDIDRPDLNQLAGQSGYIQLARVLFGAPIYEYSKRIERIEDRDTGTRPVESNRNGFSSVLHIGVSAAAVKNELLNPIATNLVIGLLAILGATIVAIGSTNLLLQPLEVISTSIDRLGLAEESAASSGVRLPPDQMVTGVTTRLRQLGERMAGERSELEIMRGRLRQVVSHLEERLLLINREGRVMLASPDAEQILGVHNTELTGLPIDETLGRDHPLIEVIERSFGERRSIPRRTLLVPDGERTRQLLASVQYIEDAGEPVGVLVSIRDYESFRKYESQWDLSKKLADLGRITSGIAHEVKNPLNAMVIHLEILRSKLDSGSSDPKPHLEILDSEIKRLDRVVQTFLNFTRPIDIHLEPLDLNSIVSQVATLASTEAEEMGVTINTHLSPAPLLIKGDSDMLTQVLLNIIINGCQAMPEGGPLKVTTSRAADGSARVGITDRGVGIGEEGRDRIFNLYYTTKKGGTGIGLAQAFRAIQLHNGSIRFDSEVGVGSTFEIILPATS
ncbi:MAG TPA: ATP-binding protein [Blastocatellia bacterium]|nr:ATP-binding protein [Blastocatellia bacterium]